MDIPLEIQWESWGDPLKFHGNPNGLLFGNPLDTHWKSFWNPFEKTMEILSFPMDPKQIRDEVIGNPFGNPLGIHFQFEWNPNELLSF